jgi:MFS transporter, DHA2 family, multidrug resistance protein
MAEKGLRKWIITGTVITGALLELIDTTIVNVSFPQIQRNLGGGLSDAAWLITAYSVANVIILPMSGWLGNHFGRKNYFLISIILFTLASLLCGQSHSLGELIGFRIFQGLAGGGLISTAQAILLDTWPREQASTATVIFGVGAIFGPTIGPAIGGYIIDHAAWRWIFYVNIPLGIFAGAFTYWFLKATPRAGKDKQIDWWGIGLLALTVGSLQFILEKGQDFGWFSNRYIVLLAIVAASGLTLFLRRELKIDYPVVNFRIMRHRSFAAGMITSFVLGVAFYGSMFIFPVFCQTILGFSAQRTGALLVPSGLFTLLTMPVVGVLLKKGIPAQFIATLGAILFFTFSFWLSHSALSSTPNDFFWPLAIRGVGVAMLFVPIITLAVGGLKGDEIGQGTGLNNMMRQLGGSFGIAVITIFIHIRYLSHIQILQPLAGPIAAAAKKQGLMLTYNDSYLAVGLVMLMAIPLLFIAPLKKRVLS